MEDTGELAASIANSILTIVSENTQTMEAVCGIADAADRAELASTVISGILKFAAHRPLPVPRKQKEAPAFHYKNPSYTRDFSSSEFSSETDDFSDDCSDLCDSGIRSIAGSSFTGTGEFSEDSDERQSKRGIDRIPLPCSEFSQESVTNNGCSHEQKPGGEFSQESGLGTEFSQGFDPTNAFSQGFNRASEAVVNSSDPRLIEGHNGDFSQDSDLEPSQGHPNGFPNDVIAMPPVASLHNDCFSQDSDVDQLTGAFGEFSQDEE